jgi:hypothetical protein
LDAAATIVEDPSLNGVALAGMAALPGPNFGKYMQKWDLPGVGSGWTKLKGNQGWKDSGGNIWKKDMKHKDHYDISDKKGNKIREVDFDGNEIWPNGPKNKNKG